MNDQKNKQPQQSQHGNKQDQDLNQQGQKSNNQDKNNQDKDKQRMQSNIENPDQPDKRTDINDDPSETKKKIPNMQDKH